MKITLLLVLSVFSLSSFANCYNFVNGKGPSKMGLVNWSPYKATQICISDVGRVNGRSYLSARFSDDLGDIMQISVAESNGRCGANRICKSYTAVSGNSDGRNLSESEISSINFTLDLDFKQNINLFTGTMTDNSTGQMSLVMKK